MDGRECRIKGEAEAFSSSLGMLIKWKIDTDADAFLSISRARNTVERRCEVDLSSYEIRSSEHARILDRLSLTPSVFFAWR